VSNPTDSPDLVEVIRLAVQNRLALVHTSIPARVLEYDRDTQLADVQVLIRFRQRHPTTGELSAYMPEPIPNVPVVWPAGAGGSLTFDLAKGDRGWLLVSERSLDEWKETGQVDSTPADVRRFDLTDASFIPGGQAKPQALPGTAHAAAAAVLRGDDVRLGSSNASDPVALSPAVQTELNKLLNLLQNWTVVPNDGGLALQTAALLLSIGPTAASKVKAE